MTANRPLLLHHSCHGGEGGGERKSGSEGGVCGRRERREGGREG